MMFAEIYLPLSIEISKPTSFHAEKIFPQKLLHMHKNSISLILDIHSTVLDFQILGTRGLRSAVRPAGPGGGQGPPHWYPGMQPNEQDQYSCHGLDIRSLINDIHPDFKSSVRSTGYPAYPIFSLLSCRTNGVNQTFRFVEGIWYVEL